MENIRVGMAKKELVSDLKGGSLIGLNFISPAFDKESGIYEFRIA